MLANPRTPVVVGGMAILALGAYLYTRSPMPGALSEPHARLDRFVLIGDCYGCHGEGGLTEGCLGCHTEIAGQARGGAGYHGSLFREGEVTCIPCHGEHYGPKFPLISSLSWGESSAEQFDHGHVTFHLHGRHDEIACDDCHERKRDAPFVLQGFADFPRARTFLGLLQRCDHCHEDVHAGGLSGACDKCHDQERFRPASRFDHAPHFPLLGPHATAPCRGCHPLPEATVEGKDALPFSQVSGKLCADCHPTPHRAPFSGACQECHPADALAWSAAVAGITPTVHAIAGFRLDPPHHQVACEKCHEPGLPFAERYRHPLAPGYDRRPELCGSCHGDPHGGQFAGRHPGCLDCHETRGFVPTLFDRQRHEEVYPLQGKHAALECNACHRKESDEAPRRFAGLSTDCASCHDDPHGGQFTGAYPGCDGCHHAEGFVPSRFDLARHADVFAVEGVHLAVPCFGCHRADAATQVRRFAGTPSSCRECHVDPHGGQFDADLATGDCSTCHGRAPHTFAIRPFDHESRTGYALMGAHSAADCSGCHRRVAVDARPVDAPGGAEIWVRYRGTSKDCVSCHRDEHRGQFRDEDGRVRCDRCHASPTAWKVPRFDHSVDSRFALDGTHAKAPCGGCHPKVMDSEGRGFVQYRPLGTNCEDCHAILPRQTR